MATQAPSQIDPKLLEILRCPVAVHYTDKGDDPGKLELVRDTWLYCADSGYKYPIINGIPKMLVEEGARWKDTEIDDLPVPSPNEPIPGAAEEALSPEMQQVVDELKTTASTTKTSAAQKLQETAQSIRQKARETSPNGTVNHRAEELARELEGAAQQISGKMTPQPTTSPQSLPWKIIGAIFAVGLFIGVALRGGKKQ